MRRRPSPATPAPEAWGLDVSAAGALLVQGVQVADLARRFGTPLHVVNEPRLAETARAFRAAFEAAWDGPVSVHYAFKCNAVPAVVDTIRRAGLRAEVMSPFELDLALRLGFPPEAIVVNGPCKTDAFLEACVRRRVRLVVIDSLGELDDLDRVARRQRRRQDVLLRVNPDYVPRGMNRGSATGSRTGCAFGLDLKGGEVGRALQAFGRVRNLRFRGFHLHVGTGIYDPRDYTRALRCLKALLGMARVARLAVDVLDVGGGFASPTTRELTARELLLYQGLGRRPRRARARAPADFEAFARAVHDGVRRWIPSGPLPELIVEPGRAIASANQMLLLTVHRIKERPGAGTWLITDGGLGTVTMPTYYEVHEVFLANDVRRPPQGRATVLGPGCFAGDVVFRNHPLPVVNEGEVLAVMDSGAYFTALESTFGYPRPGVVAASAGSVRRVRRPETTLDMLARDDLPPPPTGDGQAAATPTPQDATP